MLPLHYSRTQMHDNKMHDAFVSAELGQAPAAPSAGEEVMNGRQLGIFSQTKWG